MSIVQKIILNQARYNLWANQQLLTTVSEIPDDSYRAHAGLVFRSIHGTLNHILATDKLWLARFTENYENYEELSKFWRMSSNIPLAKDATSSHWESFLSDRKELSAKIIEQSQKWINHISALPSTLDIESKFLTYANSSGVTVTTNALVDYLHIFNHSTHHRGQISAAITGFGYKAPTMDLLYFKQDHIN
ncbi:2934_t:CDS:2 [Ambispora gerdemannii]|uniref:2934_t:CDS:1 n=1 Tax=Ambispora gerdemannii TaxID=144530 RepID=A0A9N8V1R1_9GLOM|nr:2934_t:CDS:2 [Ambispora gerdemannii]